MSRINAPLTAGPGSGTFAACVMGTAWTSVLDCVFMPVVQMAGQSPKLRDVYVPLHFTEKYFPRKVLDVVAFYSF